MTRFPKLLFINKNPRNSSIMSLSYITPPQDFLFAECWILPAHETLFPHHLVAHIQNQRFVHLHRFYYRNGVYDELIFDPWDQTQWLPDPHYGVVDETLIFDSSDQSAPGSDEGPSEEAIAKHVKSRSRYQASGDGDGDSGVCVVCQVDLVEENRRLITRLDCGHEYHAHCIRKWLMIKNTCPMCKAAALQPS